MKYSEFLIATGNNMAEAIQALHTKLQSDYSDKQCRIGQLFALPEAQIISQVAATPNGQPQMKMVINIVAVIEEEMEIDNLQRNYKPIFDFLNKNSSTIGNLILGWITATTGNIQKDAVNNFQGNSAGSQMPYNE